MLMKDFYYNERNIKLRVKKQRRDTMKKLEMKFKGESGVYKISNIVNEKVYIGSACDLYRRSKEHLIMLTNNKHDNPYLQNAWNIHGKEHFNLEIIEFVPDRANLLNREQYWMDITNCYNRIYGYNISPTAGSTLGLKHSKEARRNNSLAKRGVFASISVSKASAIKQKLNEGYGIAEIATQLNVPYDTVTSIRKGRTFTYVDPQIYVEEINLKNTLDPTKDIPEIKRLLSLGFRVNDLSEMFNVNYRTISAIKNNLNWKEVGEEVIAPRRRKRLSVKTVIEIKNMIEQGLTNKEIAHKFNTLRSTISDIRRGYIWKNIK